MNKLVIALLGAVTLFAVVFVFVELHAPLSSEDVHDARTPRPGTPWVPPPLPPPSPSHPSAFGLPSPAGAPPSTHAERPPQLPPVPQPATSGAHDPANDVIDGKTRREWHAYYDERQRKSAIELLRYQTLVDRAVAGEEPDPKELGEAHDRIREINARLKEDLEALQRIDATP